MDINRTEFEHLSRERIIDLLIAEIQITEKLSEENERLLSLWSMSHIVTHSFPGGEIQVAVVHIDGMVHHAYRYNRAHGSDQWYAPVASNAAESAVKLAYGREKIMGRQKTAKEVWDDMLPYLVPIPQMQE